MTNPEGAKPSVMKKYKNVVALILILLLPSGLYIFLSTGKHNIITLPYFGEKEAIERLENSKKVTDTLYHTVANFNFTNQDKQKFGSENLKGNFYLANYFFANCPSICKDMSANIYYLQGRLEEYNDVKFISFTCDPQRDTVEALKAYSDLVHANNKQWNFVTGNRDSLYQFAASQLLIPAAEDALAPGGFLHSEYFILVDKQNHIRGLYDGTQLKEVNRLIDEIKVLKAEELIPRKKKK